MPQRPFLCRRTDPFPTDLLLLDRGTRLHFSGRQEQVGMANSNEDVLDESGRSSSDEGVRDESVMCVTEAGDGARCEAATGTKQRSANQGSSPRATGLVG